MSLRSAIITRAADTISTISKGTVLTQDFLAELLQETPRSDEYYTKTESLKKELERRSIFVDTLPKTGLKIVETDNTYKFVDGCIEKKKKLLGRQFKKIERIPIAEMSDKAREEAMMGIQKHSAIAMMLKFGANAIAKR